MISKFIPSTEIQNYNICKIKLGGIEADSLTLRSRDMPIKIKNNGQRAYIKYGHGCMGEQEACFRPANGVETNYSYDENRRWLNNIETSNSFNTLQNIDYTFDRTGNILSIINVSGRYLANQSYEYDGLYQLTKGAGYFEDREFGFVQGTSNYTQNFTYDNTGNILSKTSSNIVNPSGGVTSLNYNLEYSYYADKPKQESFFRYITF